MKHYPKDIKEYFNQYVVSKIKKESLTAQQILDETN